MKRTVTFLALLWLTQGPAIASGQEGVTRYVRYEAPDGHVAYGVLEDRTIHELDGNLFDMPAVTEQTYDLSEVHLLAPVKPSKVLAMGPNYASHGGEAAPTGDLPIFLKLPTSIVGPGDDIVRPHDAENLHYEAEMVIVIGQRAENVSTEDALDYVLGVTAGNDVSERGWQGGDLQWVRGKASDTFGPIGPVITRGVDYDDLLLISRLNGEVRQEERTSYLIFGVAEIVSYMSQYITLEPGDLIFTGTPGSTEAMVGGDVIEIELEHVGVLRNTVRQEVR